MFLIRPSPCHARTYASIDPVVTRGSFENAGSPLATE
jgi:hypothetical protein